MSRVKVFIKGDCDTGKTQLLNRLSDSSFSNRYIATIGLDFAKYAHNENNFFLWDTAGQERFQTFDPEMLKDSKVILYCISVSSSNLSAFLAFYKKDIVNTQSNYPTAKIIIVATKMDKKEDNFNNLTLIHEVAKQYNCPCIETSAKDNTGIIELKNQISALAKPAATTESQINVEKERLKSIINTLISNIEDGTGRKTSGRGSAKVVKLQNELTAITTTENFDEQATIVRLKKICAEQRHPWRLFHTPHSARELEELLVPSPTISTLLQK
ncbi:Rab family GTPase [Legionella dresdenensis]|uniref:Rab family GTPase n=1 Tax=Legionella dresdenensis TaxID=450200 RepID=A0ABV8CHR7_9GAMM